VQQLAAGDGAAFLERPEANRELMLFLDSTLFYLRVQADCIAQLVPYFYGPDHRADIAHHSFHRQREWFLTKQPDFDPAYAAILSSELAWFDAIRGVGEGQLHQGLRDLRTHKSARYQILGRNEDDGSPELAAGLWDFTGWQVEDALGEAREAV